MAASRQRNAKRGGERRTLISGTLSLHGNEDNLRLTIPQDLDGEDFPNNLGVEIKLVLVETEDDSFLEVHPKDGS